MNFRVDIMIVGDSTTGHGILDKLASSNSALKLAFISRAFKSTTTHDYVNVNYFKDEVMYVSYRHRLFCCYLKNGNNIFSTHLILSTGLNYEPLIINNTVVPCVYNSADVLQKTAKDLPALVIFNQKSDINFALEVAQKYKQVYLCTTELIITESLSAAASKKLAKTENIVVLPNTSIKNVISDKNGILQKVELDNYSTVNCAAIYVKTSAKPAIEFIPRKLLSRQENYPVVTEKCESTLVPRCFTVGSCLKKYTKAMEQKLVETILKDF